MIKSNEESVDCSQDVLFANEKKKSVCGSTDHEVYKAYLSLLLLSRSDCIHSHCRQRSLSFQTSRQDETTHLKSFGAFLKNSFFKVEIFLKSFCLSIKIPVTPFQFKIFIPVKLNAKLMILSNYSQLSKILSEKLELICWLDHL